MISQKIEKNSQKRKEKNSQKRKDKISQKKKKKKFRKKKMGKPKRGGKSTEFGAGDFISAAIGPRRAVGVHGCCLTGIVSISISNCC